MKPTIVLVHGAFAESASWDDVIDPLLEAGHKFCADVPAPRAARMAATQRPVTLEALSESSGALSLWRERPSWFLVAEDDRNVPAALQRFMAERAGARRARELPGASHAVAVSQPDAPADLILGAAAVPAAAWRNT